MIPWLGMAIAGVFGYVQSGRVDKSQAETKQAQEIAKGEKARADTNDKVLKAIVKQNKVTESEIEDEVNRAVNDRGYFTKQLL